MASPLTRRGRSVQSFPPGAQGARGGVSGGDDMRDDTHNPALALGLILAATVFIAATTLIAKLLSQGQIGPALHPVQISQGRFLFGFMAISAVALVLRPGFTRPRWAIHAGRTAAGWAGVTLMFAAVGFIPLADATAISFLNPVFAMLLSIPLLGEKVGPIRWGAAAIALTGALILLRPSPASFQPAAMLALAAAVTLGLEVTVIKFLAGREGWVQILLINNGLGAVIASAAALLVWQAPAPAEWLALALLGTLMVCAQICYTNALRFADASFVAPLTYATLVFAALFDFAAFGVVPDAVTGHCQVV